MQDSSLGDVVQHIHELQELVIEVRDARHPDGTHRGLLIAEDLVLVHGFPQWAKDTGSDPVAVFSGKPESADAVEEQIAVATIDVIKFEGGEESDAAITIFKLSHASQNTPVSARLNRRLFEAQLGQTHNIASALGTSLELRQDYQPSPPVDKAQRSAALQPAGEREERLREHLLHTPGDTGILLCLFFACWNEPEGGGEPSTPAADLPKP